MRHFLTCAVLALAFTSLGAAASSEDQLDAASTNVAPQAETEVQAYLANIDRMLALAFSGQYGTLKRGSTEKLESARERLEVLLGSRTTIGTLPADDMMALQNIEDNISSILRSKEKDRMVCKRLLKTGSRVSTTECLTVAEREARAASAAESTSMVQREKCIPTSDNPCGAF